MKRQRRYPSWRGVAAGSLLLAALTLLFLSLDGEGDSAGWVREERALIRREARVQWSRRELARQRREATGKTASHLRGAARGRGSAPLPRQGEIL